jgi:cytochrome c-type biogenesis protein CcmH
VTTLAAPGAPASEVQPPRSRSVVSRWAPWIVLLAVAVGALAIGVQRHSHPTLRQETMSIANEVRCPVCSGETAAQSDTAQSLDIQLFIRNELVAGESRSKILAQLSARGVDLVLWVLPVLAVLVAIGGLGLVFARWRVARGGEISDEDRALVGGALDRPLDDPPLDPMVVHDPATGQEP